MIFGKKQKKPSSAEIAKSRLSLVLEEDRINLRQEQKEEMQRRLYDVVQEFLPNIDLHIDITYGQDSPEVKVVANRSKRKSGLAT